ncbi:uncharacterized protein LOC114518800 [Dendronephthya gigantea]|uniref:uncharacterized protein LOC114518800 n=1 Tax=Dendronephthya gigantea TaxID=151771 RepID=UPI00106B5C43|nr:uncharacterized protein LOC114518800 [Dendronephthya gigantea]
MSRLEIPLWKQELLKRKQAKLGNENLVSTQNSKGSDPNPRHRNAINTNLSSSNHNLDNSVEKGHYEIGKNYGFNKQNTDSGCTTTKKCPTYNRNIILDSSVDSIDTRQASEKSKILSVDTGPSRLDSLDTTSNRNVGKYNKCDFAYGLSGVSSDIRMQKSSEALKNIEKSNRANNEQDGPQELEITQGVETKHISPRDVKKMWQLQTTKDEILPKSPVSKSPVSKSPSPTKEIPKTLSPSLQNAPHQITTNVGSNPTPVPKAYKSPYAKKQWQRSASKGDEKSVKKNFILSKENETKLHAQKSSSGKSGMANNNIDKDDEVEHIQSVKSLLGLFGGQAKPKVNRKVSENSVKTEGEKVCHTTEIKKPGLFKHHSEPNLYFDKKVVNDISTSPRKSPTSPKKSPTVDVEVDDVALPSHHVSQGIQERMTRLRRASHSNMEDMDGFIEYENRLNNGVESVHLVQNHDESQHVQINQKQNPQLNDKVAENISKSHMKNNEEQDNILKKDSKTKNTSDSMDKTLVHNRNHRNVARIMVTQKRNTENKIIAPENRQVSKQNQDNLSNSVTNTAIRNDNEKLGLSESVNSHNQMPDNRSSTNEINRSTVNNAVKSKEVKSDPNDQSFDKPVSVLGTGITKKVATVPDLADANEHKSNNKYQNKQSNYVVENSESDSSLHNNVLSTDRSTGIKQNKQEEKLVIKNKETVKEVEEKKPRRKGLNVVDPLAVLQLTKDPILLKEQPVAADLGLIKELPSGKKPKVDIIKHEPDKKAKIAQINRAWDLDNNPKTPKHNGVVHRNMPASSLQVSPTNVPVTTIDEIPVSVIDDLATNKPTAAVQANSDVTSSRGVNIGNATFYNGALVAGSESEVGGDEDEFIPISSIDAEVDLGPPPEIVFDSVPGNLKSSFARHGKTKQGKISFFEHVFIHDYQSETAAASDWDYENGTSFSSYTPAALKQYNDASKSFDTSPVPKPQPSTPPSIPKETRDNEPIITYNEDESIDFTESSDSTAGALLF